MKTQLGTAVHRGLIGLYGLVFCFSLLDIVTTKLCFLGGAIEVNSTAAFLFSVYGFGDAVIFRLVFTGALFGASEIMFWRVDSRRQELPWKITLSKWILFAGWLIIAVSLFFVVLNNVEVLKEIGYF